MRDLLADIVGWVFSFFVWAFLLRLLMQLVRADFRNPLAQAVVKLTNPAVLPLRRVLPPLGRVDTASVVALLATQALEIVLEQLALRGAAPGALVLLVLTVFKLLGQAATFYLIAIFIWAVLSWVVPDGYSPAGRLLGDLVEPLMRPARRLAPRLEGLDLSPLLVCVVLLVGIKLIDMVGAQVLLLVR
ncbi:MAG TPA: YggT family protein [Steroidobacteraceae bacterium]|nr:YggT family protein [Steroidobacteraceae bacterium]